MSITLGALRGVPDVHPGADLAALIVDAAGDRVLDASLAVAIAHTVVSKAEGALVTLADVVPGGQAEQIAAEHGKDPRLVQVVLDESSEVLRNERGVIVSRTRHGLVCANAGVDTSNSTASGTVVLLPRDPDRSARELRARIAALSGAAGAPAVLITDTFGRTWRHGQTDVAIGLAGFAPLEDWRGRTDATGLELSATWLAVADAAAGAADLARRKDSREPVVLIEGIAHLISAEDGPGAAALIRPPAEDLFR
jgi:coenzyme F420-0:L-glutamate ligase/coenzyme F420-1:gamma-L-glutamate ligase